MSNRTLALDEATSNYLHSNIRPESDAEAALRVRTASMSAAVMQICPEQGAFMSLLCRIQGVRKAIEVGTFTGYSALCVAEALPDDGILIACDVSETWTNIGKEYWQEAGVSHKIDLRLAPATLTLQQLIDEGESDFDFAFIDADKENYEVYYEKCLQLLRVGGIVAIDNVLWGGRTADQNVNDESTVAIRAINEKVRNDSRVFSTMLPLGDGLTLALKL